MSVWRNLSVRGCLDKSDLIGLLYQQPSSRSFRCSSDAKASDARASDARAFDARVSEFVCLSVCLSVWHVLFVCLGKSSLSDSISSQITVAQQARSSNLPDEGRAARTDAPGTTKPRTLQLLDDSHRDSRMTASQHTPLRQKQRARSALAGTDDSGAGEY